MRLSRGLGSEHDASGRLHVRRISKSLSGYLCGTDSGLAAIGRRIRRSPVPGPEEIAATHRELHAQDAAERGSLGGERWNPSGSERALCQRLREAMDHPLVVELILFGSQARGGITGFSDVDAILVVRDEAADDATALRSLRARVLAAQRAVLAYQPMQHHGFEVVTPRLLGDASGALALPAVAVAETRSLNGRPVASFIDNDYSPQAGDALRAVARSVLAFRAWPSHPWEAHRLIAMFELLPTLYVQSRHKAVAKSDSFAEARADFTSSWWLYDVLNDIRNAWPRTRRPLLETSAALVRNPWVSVAVWRRLPGSVPQPVRPFLTPRVLDGLHGLARAMAT
jgi:hypothetical protein